MLIKVFFYIFIISYLFKKKTKKMEGEIHRGIQSLKFQYIMMQQIYKLNSKFFLKKI